MKPAISILLFFALPFIIYGGKVPELYVEDVAKINILARNGKDINGALLLKEDGLLGEGGYGFVYEGTLKEDNRPVAIKFVNNRYIGSCEREFEMYSYLKAYKNETVEKYGFSAIYYYDRWDNYIVTAMTKLDKDLLDIALDVTTLGNNPLDILMLLRDFVFQSKYLHSHGVRHDDIKPDNFMVRGHQSFLIDLNSSSKMKEDLRGGTPDYICKRFAAHKKRRAIDDYESFIYTICAIMRKNWFTTGSNNKIRKDLLRNHGLEKIIKAFADEVFTDNDSKEFPDYNNLEGMISREIKRIHPNGSPKFSWVTTDTETSPVRKITDIAEPKSFDFTNFEYPPILRLPPILETCTSTSQKKQQ